MCVLMLDIVMPIIDGLEAVVQTKKLYKSFNEKACEKRNLDPQQHELILLPFIILATQLKYTNQFITVEEEADLYIEKPI